MARRVRATHRIRSTLSGCLPLSSLELHDHQQQQPASTTERAGSWRRAATSGLDSSSSCAATAALCKHYGMLFATQKMFDVLDSVSSAQTGKEVLHAWAAQMALGDANVDTTEASRCTASNAAASPSASPPTQVEGEAVEHGTNGCSGGAYVASTVPPYALLVRLMAVMESPMELLRSPAAASTSSSGSTASPSPPLAHQQVVVNAIADMVLRLERDGPHPHQDAAGGVREGDDVDIISSIAVATCAVAVRLWLSQLVHADDINAATTQLAATPTSDLPSHLDEGYRSTCESVATMLRRCVPWIGIDAVSHARRAVLRRLVAFGVGQWPRDHDDLIPLAVKRAHALRTVYSAAMAHEGAGGCLAMDVLHVVLTAAHEWNVCVPVAWADEALSTMHAQNSHLLSGQARGNRTGAVLPVVIDIIRQHHLTDLVTARGEVLAFARDAEDDDQTSILHQQLVNAVLFVRCASAGGGAAGGGGAAMAPPSPPSNIDDQLQFIHKALRAAKEHNRIGSVLAVRQRLIAQFPVQGHAAASAPTTTPMIDPSTEKVQQLLRVYCNGTALMQLGHMVDRCSDWTLDRFTEIASIVQALVDSCVQIDKEDLDDAGAVVNRPSPNADGATAADAPHPMVAAQWKTTVLNRAHEGLRLALKCYVRARKFLEATRAYEQYPAMGPSWEVACCYSGCHEPFQAVVVFQQFLDIVVPKTFASVGVPAFISAKLLDVVQQAGAQAARWPTDNHGTDRVGISLTTINDVLALVQEALQQQGPPPRLMDAGEPNAPVRAASWLRKKFEATVGSGVLKGIPPTLVFERFVCGVVGTALRPGAATTAATMATSVRTTIPTDPAHETSLWIALLTLVVEHSVDRRAGCMSCAWATKPVGITRNAVESCCLALNRLLSLAKPGVGHQPPLAAAAEGGASGEAMPSDDPTIIQLLLGVLDVLHASFPRLNVWAIAVEWFLSRSGRPNVVLELLLHRASVTTIVPGADAPPAASPPLREDEMLVLFDALSQPLVATLRQHVIEASMRSTGKNTGLQKEQREATASALIALMDASIAQKHSFNTLKTPWQCTYCSATCPARATACHVCSALKLHLWQCHACRGFSPSTHPDQCLVCTTPRSNPDDKRNNATAEEEAIHPRVISLRRWTCKFCRTSNEPTHALFCSGCKEPSWAAVTSKAMVPFDCTSCGRSQIKGMLRPWCDHCGTVHEAARASATVWSCSTCFRWNPWVAFQCGECHATKPALAALVVEQPWQPWMCLVCEGQNAAWRDDCGHCTAPRPLGASLRSGANGVSGESDEMVPTDASMGVAADHNSRPCPICLEPALSIEGEFQGDGRCLSCGHDNGAAADRAAAGALQDLTVWVCLRAGCLHVNATPPNARGSSHPSPCEKCGLRKGLTTTLAAHTNVFRYKQEEVQAEDSKDLPPGNRTGPADMLEPVDVLAPTAVGVHAKGGVCTGCGAPLGALNLIQLCSVCLASSCHVVVDGANATAPSDDPMTELLLWLHVAAARVVLQHCGGTADGGRGTAIASTMMHDDVGVTTRTPSRATLTDGRSDGDAAAPPSVGLSPRTALAVVRVTTRALRAVHPSQLPWQGRDIANMRCAVSARNPVHEPSGAPHSALQAVRTLVDALVHQSQRSREHCHELRGDSQHPRLWLLVALDLVDVVNESTDFDELSFSTLSRLARAIQQLPEVVSPKAAFARAKADATVWTETRPQGGRWRDDDATGEGDCGDDDASLDPLRLEYLISMKLPTAVLVGADRCRDCLHKACVCPSSSRTGKLATRTKGHNGDANGGGGGNRRDRTRSAGARSPPPTATSPRRSQMVPSSAADVS